MEPGQGIPRAVERAGDVSCGEPRLDTAGKTVLSGNKPHGGADSAEFED